MATMTAVPKSSSDLAEEVQRLEADLRSAQESTITPADRKIAAIRDQLQKKKAEFDAVTATEALAEQKRQHAQRLLQLVETEKEINRMKSEIVATKRVIAELPAKLAASEYQLNQLLRTYAQLKQEIAQ